MFTRKSCDVPKLLLNAMMSFLISTSWRHSSEFSVRIRITTFETAVNSWRSSQVRLTKVSKLSDPSTVELGTGVPSEFRVEWWTKSSTAKNPRICVKKSAKSWAKFMFDFFRFLGILKSSEACSSRSRRYWVMKDSFPPKKSQIFRFFGVKSQCTPNTRYKSKHIFTWKGSDWNSAEKASHYVGFDCLFPREEFKWNPLAPNAISYDTRATTNWTDYCRVSTRLTSRLV